MPPKRGTKRKGGSDAANGAATPGAPDRATWPGWVELESEPSFFNVMLKEMGVQGVKIEECLSMDDDMMAMLPQPVHALIFLYRYHTADQDDEEEDSTPKHIWFANQIPEFACASVALLNIVNNIPGLNMGKELRDFKEFTQDMNPIMRGESIDSFDFVKRIHNSFARETDLLAADMHMKTKFDRSRKRQATAKAKAARAAKQKTALAEKSANAAAKPSRAGARGKKSSPTPPAKGNESRKQGKSTATPGSGDEDEDFEPVPEKRDATPDETPSKPRRSGRAPKPRQEVVATPKEVVQEEDSGEEGFHFIAYVPVNGHVWKLDGMDSHTQDLGAYGTDPTGADGGSGNWLHVAQPTILSRMQQFEGEDIEFNLMAVVHDASDDRNALLRNIKSLQAVEHKLDALFDHWRAVDAHAETTEKDLVTGISPEFGISQFDIDNAELPEETGAEIAEQVPVAELVDLLELRKELITRQSNLRAGALNALTVTNVDDERARHRRHDYGAFLRGWLAALAEEDTLATLLE